MRVAVIQFEPQLFAVQRNVDILMEHCLEAIRQGAELIVLPEMATSGYCLLGPDEADRVAEPIPGPISDRFVEVCRQHGCTIFVGMPERGPVPGLYFNSVAVCTPAGVADVYRKTHSWICEPLWAADGDTPLTVVETSSGHIGALICMDADYPEPARVERVLGAQAIAFPTNWLAELSPSASWWARSLESGVAFLAANRYGMERGVQFSGGSCIFDADGGIVTWQASGDAVLVADVESGGGFWSREEFRRPDLYGALVRNTHLFEMAQSAALYGRPGLPQGGAFDVAVWPAAHWPTAFQADVMVLPPQDADLGAVGARAMDLSAQSGGALVIVEAREQTGSHAYRSVVAVDAGGERARYRRAHLSPEERAAGYAAGERLVHFDTDRARVGLLGGHELLFPEAARCLAAEGCDLVAISSQAGLIALDHPSGDPQGRRQYCLARVRSGENDIIVALADAQGTSGVFFGDFYSARQEVAAEGGDWLRLAVDSRTTRRKWPLVRRRTDLYRPLIGDFTDVRKEAPTLR